MTPPLNSRCSSGSLNSASATQRRASFTSSNRCACAPARLDQKFSWPWCLWLIFIWAWVPELATSRFTWSPLVVAVRRRLGIRQTGPFLLLRHQDACRVKDMNQPDSTYPDTPRTNLRWSRVGIAYSHWTYRPGWLLEPRITDPCAHDIILALETVWIKNVYLLAYGLSAYTPNSSKVLPFVIPL